MGSSQELALLQPQERSTEGYITSCNECDYDTVLSSDLAQNLFLANTDDCPDIDTFLGHIDKTLECIVNTGAIQLRTLAIAIALLNAFLQVNFTGPALPDKSTFLLPAKLSKLPKEQLHGQILDRLVVDGERPYPLAEDLIYLMLALRIMNHDALASLPSRAWWHIRINFVHQKLLDDPVSTIHNIICDEQAVSQIEQLIEGMQELQARFHLELAHFYSYYSYDQKAMFQVKEAQRTSRLIMQVSGALGRRTKFQTFDVSQLVVLARSSDKETKSRDALSEVSTAQPKVLDLDDDTLLENVSFSKTNEEAEYRTRYINPVAEVVSTEKLVPALAHLDPGNQPQLSLVDQCILLTYAGVIKVSAASDDQIIIEQVAAYIARVLHKEIKSENSLSNWTINSAALLARTRVEGHRSRTVERSVLQLQALVDQLIDDIAATNSLPLLNGIEASQTQSSQNVSFLTRGSQQITAPPKERLSHLFCLPLASKWDLQLELARKYTSIGLVKSALEIFERLEIWEQVALCYGVMEREDKAESVLRAQLELSKAGADLPKLWCLLGDVTSDPQYWEKSWEVSRQHYARAQRSLGKWYFGQKNYGKAIESYALSLKINPLNHGAWFIYGCCGLETSQFEVAAEAFTRCISIDTMDGESWNNLASALLSLGGDRKKDAWKALKTATNLKYDSWRMWENYMLVSLDLLEFTEVVRAMRRCIEIRTDQGESAVDIEVLGLLIQEVIGAEPVTEVVVGEAESQLRGLPRMVNDLMLNTIQPLITHDARLWKLLAKLYIWRRKYAEALDAQEKAYRCLSGKLVESEFSVFRELVGAVEELSDAYRSLGPMEGRMGGLVAKDWKFKSRSVVRTLRARGTNFDETQEYQRLCDILEDLKSA